MFSNKLLLAAGLCLSVLFTNCKKDETTPDDQNNPTTQQPTVNYLCDGDKSATYWPLKEGNSWTTSSAFGSTTGTIKGTQTYNGETYSVIQYTSSGSGYNHYYRTASNGDVFQYVIYDNTPEATKDYLVIPGNPQVGTEWEFAPVLLYQGQMNKRVVTALNATVKTAKCEYKDLIEIKEYAHDGSLVNTLYFKKGLGVVREKSNWGNDDLTAVTLK